MNNARYELAASISRLKPGERIDIPRTALMGIPQRSPYGGESPVDLVLDLVVGSKHDITYWEGPNGFTFERKNQPRAVWDSKPATKADLFNALDHARDMILGGPNG